MTTLQLKVEAAKTTRAWQLALDKFPFNLNRLLTPSLTETDNRGKEQSIKATRLHEIRDRYSAAQSDLKTATERYQRFLVTLAHQHGTSFRRVTLVNSSRILLHLGRSSILQNVGLHCDRTSGLPVIPGTAVKGVVSTWACWESNQSLDEFTTARSSFHANVIRILGANPANDPSSKDSAGCVTFLGAYPQTVPGLDLDIVTPHPDEGRGRITPNPFLAIQAGTKWDFPLLLSSRIPEHDAATLLDQAATWLADCLTQLGIGAKTASGYGNFRHLTEGEQAQDVARFDGLLAEINAAKQREAMSDEERAYHDFVKSVLDWAPLARDIASKTEPEKSHIMRFFRSDEGKALIKSWPNNDKAKARKQALKDAGL